MHESRVREVLAEHGRLTVPVESLGPDDDLYAVGMTSHATVDVMLALEDALGIELPENLLRRSTFQTIAALTAAAQTAGGEG